MRTIMLLNGNIRKEFGGLNGYQVMDKATRFNPIEGENRIMTAYEAFVAKGDGL